MSTRFGWCAGPEGSTGDHDACPREIGLWDTIVCCSCPCHQTKLED